MHTVWINFHQDRKSICGDAYEHLRSKKNPPRLLAYRRVNALILFQNNSVILNTLLRRKNLKYFQQESIVWRLLLKKTFILFHFQREIKLPSSFSQKSLNLIVFHGILADITNFDDVSCIELKMVPSRLSRYTRRPKICYTRIWKSMFFMPRWGSRSENNWIKS